MNKDKKEQLRQEFEDRFTYIQQDYDELTKKVYRHKEFNPNNLVTIVDDVWNFIEQALDQVEKAIREEAFDKVAKAIKIDRDSVFYQFNPMQQVAINEYINEIFGKLQIYLTQQSLDKGDGEDE